MSSAIPLNVISTPPPADAPAGGEDIPISAIHDFSAKLRHPDVLPRLKEYIAWRARRQAGSREPTPAFAPLSLNLDLTTVCNYRCDHCIDLEQLNTAHRFAHAKLMDSLTLMAKHGLKSVILIGGGEPTLYAGFAEVVRSLKSMRVQVAVVSNGSGNRKIADVADCLDQDDWVRLSLDAGTDETFQRLHRPRTGLTLEEICRTAGRIKQRNPRPIVGFSFIVMWDGRPGVNAHLAGNVDEIAAAAALARRSGFDYIAFKPYLYRSEANQTETIGLKESASQWPSICAQIRDQLARAKQEAGSKFTVYETTSMKHLLAAGPTCLRRQPRHCHMQFFRQVLSPLGTFHCPAYRGQECAQIGGKDAYADDASFADARRNLAGRIDDFDASSHCATISCLYNDVNWWIESLVADPARLEGVTAVTPSTPDFFL
jgi:wyosine [tRNA(Phe)-imidazoG37] synthetase (radical SAM superfamily)